MSVAWRRQSRHVVCLLLLCAPPALAQPNAADAGDAIRCWWRTSLGAVALGEAFAATLTCAARDDGARQVELDESRLPAAVVQLAPFEVLGGSHPADLRTPTHRFVQYHYSLRIIDRDVIGRDAKFPDLRLSYTVRSTVGGDSVEGRDRVYVVPGQPLRVLSLVPAEADDIRDSAGEDFTRAETLAFRARSLRIAALTLGALAVVVLVPIAVRLARGTERGTSRSGRLGARQLLPDVASALERIDVEKARGWDGELVARTLAATRLAAAAALDSPISQRAAGIDDGPSAGRLLVRRGTLRRVASTVSSALTAVDLDAALVALPLTTPAADRQALEDLRDTLAAMTPALYGREADLDASRLDAAVATARRATSRLRRKHGWPRSLLTAPHPSQPRQGQA
jgi:hypothetical protein